MIVSLLARRTLVLACAITPALGACKRPAVETAAVASTFDSQVGAHRQPRNPLTACRTFRANPRFAVATTYVTKLLDRVVSSNPTYFEGGFSREHFCVEIVDFDPGVAHVAPREPSRAPWVRDRAGVITVGLAFLRHMPNDAAVIGVLCHELAHLLMGHESFFGPMLLRSSIARNMEAQLDQLLAAQHQSYLALGNDLQFAKMDAAAAVDDLTHMAVPAPLLDARNKLVTEVQALMRHGDALETEVEEIGFERTVALSYVSEDDKASEARIRAASGKEIAPLVVDYRATAGALKDDRGDLADANETINELVSAELVSPEAATQRQALIDAAKRVQDIRARFAPTAQTIAFLSDVEKPFLESFLMTSAAKANGVEDDADKVGQLLYLNAGFHPDFFGFFETLFMRPGELQACRKAVADAVVGLAPPPDRGTEDHPDGCFRLYNAKRRQIDYDQAFADQPRPFGGRVVFVGDPSEIVAAKQVR